MDEIPSLQKKNRCTLGKRIDLNTHLHNKNSRCCQMFLMKKFFLKYSKKYFWQLHLYSFGTWVFISHVGLSITYQTLSAKRALKHQRLYIFAQLLHKSKAALKSPFCALSLMCCLLHTAKVSKLEL